VGRCRPIDSSLAPPVRHYADVVERNFNIRLIRSPIHASIL
jgi:hypothetical protein